MPIQGVGQVAQAQSTSFLARWLHPFARQFSCKRHLFEPVDSFCFVLFCFNCKKLHLLFWNYWRKRACLCVCIEMSSKMSTAPRNQNSGWHRMSQTNDFRFQSLILIRVQDEVCGLCSDMTQRYKKSQKKKLLYEGRLSQLAFQLPFEMSKGDIVCVKRLQQKHPSGFSLSPLTSACI